MQNNLYIFPSSRAIRQFQLKEIHTNQLLDKSITIGEFFQRILLHNDKIKIDDDLRILFLQEAIGNLDIKSLGLSKNFSKFYTQSEYIFKFFNELNSEYKTIEDLECSDTYALYWDHLNLLKQIYKQYISILDKNGYVDNITLPLYYKLNEDYISQYENITIYYEGYFSSFEFNIISEIAKKTNLSIEFTLNQFNKKNILLFSSINIDLEINNNYKLNISNQTITKCSEIQNKQINHTIYPIEQRVSQIAFIKYAITKMIQDGIEPSKIVILLPDESFSSYLKLFNKPDKDDCENYFNFAMGTDINHTTSIKKALAIESFIQNNEPKDSIKIEYFDIKEDYITQYIKPNWNKTINKEIFFNIIDFIFCDESNEDILSNIITIKISLENLFFPEDKKNNFENFLLKDAYKILLTKLHEISLDDVHGGAITVLGILETRHIQYDGVIVVDFNDHKIPKRSVKDKFISTNVKQIAKLPTLQDRQDLQKYYYKKLFDGTKNLMISYVSNEQNTISRFSKELFSNLNIKNIDFTSILQDEKEYKLLNQQYKIDIDLSKQQWSATSLKSYLQCKRQYYFKYIKNIKEHDYSLKPQNYEIGQILHDILEKLHKKAIFSYKILCDEISKYQGKNPYLTLDLELWKKKLYKFCINDTKRLSDGIKIYQIEKPFNLIYKNISIKGKIDRIDKHLDGKYEILDYKTSSNIKIDSVKTYENSTDFQLEFYYIATRDIQVDKVGYYDLNNGNIKSELMINEKLKRLDEIFVSLKTKNVDFVKCEDKKQCLYCTYKIMCDRE